jgi:carbon monoxide dehydrogenase subunit G
MPTLNLSFEVKKNIDVAFDYLTDMQKFAFVHPVISKIESLGKNRYMVYETLKWGFIPFSFRYLATMEQNKTEKTVVFRATVFKWTRIDMKFVLRSHHRFTTIEEEIQFNSPLPIAGIMKRVFKAQHETLFKNINAL